MMRFLPLWIVLQIILIHADSAKSNQRNVTLTNANRSRLLSYAHHGYRYRDTYAGYHNFDRFDEFDEWPSQELSQAMDEVNALYHKTWVDDLGVDFIEKEFANWHGRYYKSHIGKWFHDHPGVAFGAEFVLDLGVNLAAGGIGMAMEAAPAILGSNVAMETLSADMMAYLFGKVPDKTKQIKCKSTVLGRFVDVVAKEAAKGAIAGAIGGAAFGAIAGTGVGFVFPPVFVVGTLGGAASGAIVGSVVGVTWGTIKGLAKGIYMWQRTKTKEEALKEPGSTVSEIFLFDQLPLEYKKRLLFTLDTLREQQQILDEAAARKHDAKEAIPSKSKLKPYAKREEPFQNAYWIQNDIEQVVDNTMHLFHEDKQFNPDHKVLSITNMLFPDGHPKIKEKKPEFATEWEPLPQQYQKSWKDSALRHDAMKEKYPVFVRAPNIKINIKKILISEEVAGETPPLPEKLIKKASEGEIPHYVFEAEGEKDKTPELPDAVKRAFVARNGYVNEYEYDVASNKIPIGSLGSYSPPSFISSHSELYALTFTLLFFGGILTGIICYCIAGCTTLICYIFGKTINKGIKETDNYQDDINVEQ